MDKNMRSISDSVRKNDVWKIDGLLKAGKNYQKYFNGYTVVEVPRKTGNGTQNLYIYTADYYKRDTSDLNRRMIKCLFFAAFTVGLLLFLSNVTYPAIANATWYVVLPQAGCVAMGGWLAIAWVRVLVAHPMQTIFEYRSSSIAFINASNALLIALAAEILSLIVFLALHFSEAAANSILLIIRYLLCFAAFLIIFLTERRAVYIRVPSGDKIPENGRIIETISVEHANA